MPFEIERKFLINELPARWQEFRNERIAQGYLFNSKEGVVRVRQKGNRFFQTIKKSGLKIREEIEFELSKSQFDQMWEYASKQVISKTRYYIPYHSYTIELDIFEDSLQGLVVAEVEFKSEQESNLFKPPVWFGKEITEDQRYQNNRLATNGIPS